MMKTQASSQYQYFSLGQTQLTDDEISKALNKVIDTFGPYHLIKNNCRHFVKRGCESILLSPMDPAFDQYLDKGFWSRYNVLHSAVRADFFSTFFSGQLGKFPTLLYKYPEGI
jgi:hypothetical protein